MSDSLAISNEMLSSPVGVSALIISLASLFMTVNLWRRANRPILTARVTTHSGGSEGIALNLLIENTGNRPACEVRLRARERDVLAALVDPTSTQLPSDAKRCFFSNIIIPVLANGKTASNAFGVLGGEKATWRSGAKFSVQIRYRGLDGGTYRSKMILVLSDDAGFAQSFWDAE